MKARHLSHRQIDMAQHVNVPARMRTHLLLLALALMGLRAVAASQNPTDAPKPLECKSARSYRGKPLHPAPSAEFFAAVTSSLEGPFDTNTVLLLERALAVALDATQAPAITAAVGVPGKGLWTGTITGSVKPAGDLPRYFWWGSVGKAFTAVAVMQLVEEGRLKLNDPMARWYPEFPSAKVITIEHLLTHTSGIYSFQAAEELRKQPGYKPPETLIAVARKHGNAFCPGEYWSYSNTGYVLLARIVEAIEGQPFHQVVDARVIRRLGLKNTIALAPRIQLPGLAAPHPKKPEEVEAGFDYTTPFGAAGIAGSAEDMVRFWQALLGGRLLKQQTVRGLFDRLYPMFDHGTYYGRGVMLYDFSNGKEVNSIWLGHSGGAPGSKAIVVYSTKRRAFAAVALNTDGSAEATANLLLNALDTRP